MIILKPPEKFQITDPHKGFSLCLGCNKWKRCLDFYHDNQWWALCAYCWEDYWLNMDEILPDYKPPINYKKVYNAKKKVGNHM